MMFYDFMNVEGAKGLGLELMKLLCILLFPYDCLLLLVFQVLGLYSQEHLHKDPGICNIELMFVESAMIAFTCS